MYSPVLNELLVVELHGRDAQSLFFSNNLSTDFAKFLSYIYSSLPGCLTYIGSLAVLLLSSCKSMPPSFVVELLQQLVGEAADSEDESFQI